MVFNLGQDFYLFFLSVFFLWLTLLTIFLIRAIGHYNSLTRGVDGGDLKTVLEKILVKVDHSQDQIQDLAKKCQNLEIAERLHIQKIGVLRFNPFKDTGGNQSFVLALLNEENSGLVLSSLYTRNGNRWYVKQVVKGEGQDHELSKEEEEVIKKAKG